MTSLKKTYKKDVTLCWTSFTWFQKKLIILQGYTEKDDNDDGVGGGGGSTEAVHEAS